MKVFLLRTLFGALVYLSILGIYVYVKYLEGEFDAFWGPAGLVPVAFLSSWIFDMIGPTMTNRRLLDSNRSLEEVKRHVDEILARNSKKDPICIVCQRPVTSRQTLIDTVHGAYHGAPLNCTDGRE